MRRYVRFEIPWIPHFSHELTEPLDQGKFRITRPADVPIVFLAQKVIAQWGDVDQRLQHNVTVVIAFDVVQSNDAWVIQCTIDCTRRFNVGAVDFADGIVVERRIQQVFDVIERCIDDLVVVRQTVELQIVQIEEDMMRLGHRVCVCVRICTTALEIFATHQASVHIDARQRYGAQFLEIKVQYVAIDCVQVGALS